MDTDTLTTAATRREAALALLAQLMETHNQVPSGTLAPQQPHSHAAEPLSPPHEALVKDGNTVIQPAAPKRGSRASPVRGQIIALLRTYPEGLSASKLKGHLRLDVPLGDTLAEMVHLGFLVRTGTKKDVRYRLSAQALEEHR
jgi:hypothetical protein